MSWPSGQWPWPYIAPWGPDAHSPSYECPRCECSTYGGPPGHCGVCGYLAGQEIELAGPGLERYEFSGGAPACLFWLPDGFTLRVIGDSPLELAGGRQSLVLANRLGAIEVDHRRMPIRLLKMLGGPELAGCIGYHARVPSWWLHEVSDCPAVGGRCYYGESSYRFSTEVAPTMKAMDNPILYILAWMLNEHRTMFRMEK